jgi:hypothetical protein
MTLNRYLIGLYIIIISTIKIIAQNPIIKDVGMADPHIRIFNDKAYLYATRDADKTAKTFVMPDWNIWSSEDLVNWTFERTIKPSETYMGKSNDCWAPDTESRNGKYYFYFSNKNINTGVMIGDSPSGPFQDALGKPLLPEDLTPIKEYDPTILIDDDENKTPYIAFGHHRSNDAAFYFCIAKLNEDMISLAEKPKEIKIIGNVNVLSGNDKPTLHKRNGIYYLSAGSHYATATNVYGPYTKCGNSGNDAYGLNSRAHGNYFDWNGQSFHTWCHFHLGKDVARYRESYITYLHYRKNGEMVSDVDYLDKHFSMGVGQYDACWGKIEAEWYMGASKVEKTENFLGGFEISKVQNGGTLYFPNVKNTTCLKTITFYASSINGVTIEVYADKAETKLLGKCEFSGTGGWKSYKSISCELDNTADANNIYLKFIGKDEDLIHLDWFKFKE